MKGLDMREWSLLDWVGVVLFALSVFVPALNALLKDAPAAAERDRVNTSANVRIALIALRYRRGAYPKVTASEMLRPAMSVSKSPGAGALLAVEAGFTPTMLC